MEAFIILVSIIVCIGFGIFADQNGNIVIPEHQWTCTKSEIIKNTAICTEYVRVAEYDTEK
jgi:hypothetical protein